MGRSKFHVWDRVLCRLTGKYYAISGQSDTEADLLPDLYGFVWIRFQINHFHFSEKYADFIHRQGATNYKVHGSDFRGDKYHCGLT